MADFNKPDYSSFDLSHMHRTSFDMGKLIPISVIKTIPGDRINVDVKAFVRGMPTIAPIVDKVDIKINHFYVPYRVLWNKWGDFISHKKGTSAFPAPTIPTFKPTPRVNPEDKYLNGRLADYLGISDRSNMDKLSLFPFLAYQTIFLEYYAPARWVEYLQANGNAHPLNALKDALEQVREIENYHISNTNIKNHVFGELRTVGWNHDYFTNALPTPSLNGDVTLDFYNDNVAEDMKDLGDEYPFHSSLNFDDPVVKARRATVRDLRQNIAMQHFLEKLNYSGGRYIETMKVLWGQNIPDSTLQRPEYLGGDVIPLFVNEVEQTATTSEGNLGDLGGKPIGAGKFNDVNFVADEFGIYMCLAHVVPKRSYGDAIDKLWTQTDVFDFPLPDFEGIGDQAVKQYELCGHGEGIFGYVPRYSEYKGQIDRFSGEMKHTLKHWHMGDMGIDLAYYPEISPAFIDCNPREDIFIVQNEPDKLLGTFEINAYAKRKLGVQVLPGISRI